MARIMNIYTARVLNMISRMGFCIKDKSRAKKVIFDGFNGRFDQIKLW